MELIRGRYFKKYINSFEDLRDYDFWCRSYLYNRVVAAREWCSRHEAVELSDSEKTEIKDYWKQFGIAINDFSWHAMFYTVTGIHDPRFIPDTVAGFCLYRYYNDSSFENTWRDKNMFDRLLPDVPLPKTVLKKVRGRYAISPNLLKTGGFPDGGGYEAAIVSSCFNQICGKEIVIKNSRATGFGRSVKCYKINKEDDLKNALSEWKKQNDFIVQERIRQHSTLASLNESSNNMIRVFSWRHGNSVDIMYAAARVGMPGQNTDVSFKDGHEYVHIVGITKDGILQNRMIDEDGFVVRKLPADVKITSWDRIVQIIKKNHLLIDNFDMVGWDFTVDENAEPCCFEWNVQWPGTILYQYANGPLFGDSTEKVLEFLKDDKNKDNYVPTFMRAR